MIPSTGRAMGALIGQILESDGISQVRFAEHVGASRQHVCRVVNGSRVAHPDTLDRWANALGARFSVSLELQEQRPEVQS